MKILIYGLNYYPEQTGIGKYSGEMAEWFAAQGHDVKVIASPPYYPQWRLPVSYRNWYHKEYVNGVEIYRCPLYVPKGKVTTLKRLLHLLSFTFSSLPMLAFRFKWQPHVVINVVPALFTTPAAMLFSKIISAKLVLHIQDFESDAMFGLGMAKKGFIARSWSRVERFLLRRATRITTISKAMIENAVSKGANSETALFFPNWSEISRFESVKGVREFKASLSLPKGKTLVLYSGNIGKKQGLDLIVRAAKLKQSQGLHFVICGDGAAKLELQALAAESGLGNISFLPLQPYEKLPQLLALADVHLVIQNAGVADAVLPSKLTNILAVGGNAVITTSADTEMGKLITDYEGIAVMVKPNCEKDLVRGIELAAVTEKPNRTAINYAQKNLDKVEILSTFRDHLVKTIE